MKKQRGSVDFSSALPLLWIALTICLVLALPVSDSKEQNTRKKGDSIETLSKVILVKTLNGDDAVCYAPVVGSPPVCFDVSIDNDIFLVKDNLGVISACITRNKYGRQCYVVSE